MFEKDRSAAALLGCTIAGKFVVEAVIGTGGSGTVYRARQVALDRIVALKVLRDEVADDARFVERFKREARAASRLDHPCSVRVLDFGRHDDGLLYLAMEYVEGRTLYDVIRDEAPLDEVRVVGLLSQVLSAVAVAHDLEVIHRDLKPDNIMIVKARGDDGELTELAKVCDFGIATLGAAVRDGSDAPTGAAAITSHGFLVGTPAYMSPEQARGEPAEKRSDVYSAGIVLYHMLTGRVPFEGESGATVATKHIYDAPAPPSSVHPAVSPALEAVCMRALRKAPGERFSTAREMRAALRAGLAPSQRVAATTAGVAVPLSAMASSDSLPAVPRGRTTLIPVRSRPLVAGVTLVAVVAVGALAVTKNVGQRAKVTVAGVPIEQLGRPTAAPAPAAVVEPPSPPVAAPAPSVASEAATSPEGAILAPASPSPAGSPSRTIGSLAVSASSPPAGRSRPSSLPAGSSVRAARAIVARTGAVAPPSARRSVHLAAAAVESPARGPVVQGGADALAPPAASSPPLSPPVAPAPAAPAGPGVSSAVAAPGAVATHAPPVVVAPPLVPAPRAPVPIDPARARIAIAGITTSGGIAVSNIRAAISRVGLLDCYREALRAHGGALEGKVTLRVRIDFDGFVSDAAVLDGAALPSAAKACLERAARAARVRDVDTGDGTADVVLSLTAAP